MTREEKYMSIALKYANKSLLSGDVPIGAIIVLNNKIIGRGYNKVEKLKNPNAHAEIIAIEQAVKKIDYKHLLECEMYVTLEPCSMCAGAIVLARLKKIYIGASDPKTGACGSLYNIVNDNRLNHRCEIEYSVLENECSSIIKGFFSELRKKKNAK